MVTEGGRGRGDLREVDQSNDPVLTLARTVRRVVREELAPLIALLEELVERLDAIPPPTEHRGRRA